MPTAGFVHPLPDFWPLATSAVDPSRPTAVTLPRGFDAVVQCDLQLLNVQVIRNLHDAGLAALSVKVAYNAAGLPPELVAAIAPHIGLADVTGLGETFLELRLVTPLLTTIGRTAGPGVASGSVTLAPWFGSDGSPAEIRWSLELNLLRIELDMVVSPDSGTSPTPPSSPPPRRPLGGFRIDNEDAVFELPDRPQAPSNARERRMVLGGGRAVTRMPTRLAARPELLIAWLELDTARTATDATSTDAPLAALLQTQRGQDLLRTALWRLISRGTLRLSPQIALAGVLAQQYVAAMGLTGMQVRSKVHVSPDGREVLSLAFTFGADAGGAMSELQPFIGARNFAFHVGRDVLGAVVRARWTLRPADHEFIGDGEIEMPLHEGTEETGQGRVRVRVRLGSELTDVGTMAAVSAQGDVLRIGCDQEVQLLAAWYANGDPVQDLGELGEPATMPFVVNVAPFTPAPPTEAVDTPFRNFLLTVLEPLAVPMVERFRIHTLDGFVSEALGSSTAWWSMPTRTDEMTGGLSDTRVVNV